MEEERNWGNEVVDSVEPDLTQTNEIYDNINKLNDKLDEIAGLSKIDPTADESLEAPFKLESESYDLNEPLTPLNDLDDFDYNTSTPSFSDSIAGTDELSNPFVSETTINDDFKTIDQSVDPVGTDNQGVSSNESVLTPNNDTNNLSSEVNNEISMPSVNEEELSKDLKTKKEGKGQYILITILTIILISLLLLMVYFTTSL